MLGYRNQATTFIFEVNGEKKTICSNATRYEHVVEIMALPKTARLENAITYGISDGKKDPRTHIDYVWAFYGTLPSGEDWVEYLIKKGVIKEEEWKSVLEAEVRQL